MVESIVEARGERETTMAYARASDNVVNEIFKMCVSRKFAGTKECHNKRKFSRDWACRKDSEVKKNFHKKIDRTVRAIFLFVS